MSVIWEKGVVRVENPACEPPAPAVQRPPVLVFLCRSSLQGRGRKAGPGKTTQPQIHLPFLFLIECHYQSRPHASHTHLIVMHSQL